jgi:hypothetical protein
VPIIEKVPTEKELLERIRQLEEMNSVLQDKLDEIWAILAPVYEPDEDDGGEERSLVQIDLPNKRPSS